MKLPRKRRVHDFTNAKRDSDYIFEAIADGTKAYMTGQGRGVKPGDYLLLRMNGDTDRYEIEQVEYYASPADVWIAQLIKVPD